MEKNTAEEQNIKHWDEIAPIHLKSYDIDSLRKRISSIDSIQKEELYPIFGMDLIHLQCHIGTDTISLALDGANVVGVDFSKKSIEIAKRLTKELGLDINYIESNILEINNLIQKKYDIVYTSKGILCWISDIDKWAKAVSFLLKKGGIFYIMESHPILNMFDDEIIGDLKIKNSYFHTKNPIEYNDNHPDYSDKEYIPVNKTYEWQWALSDIVNALIRNGMRIVFIHEYEKIFYKAFDGMIQDNEGWWIMEKYNKKVPLIFTLKAEKE